MEQQKRHWWHAFLTPANLIAVGGMLVGATLTYQAQIERANVHQDRIERNDQRITALEKRIEAESIANDSVFMRKDVLVEQLRVIQEEQVRIREQVQGLRRDLK